MSRQAKFKRDRGPFEDLQVYFPKAMLTMLREVSAKQGVPISRLALYAIDNELGTPNPFAYPCTEPINTFIEHAYVEEAQLIYKYLIQFASGVGRDMLMLCRRDIGIPNKENFMLGYRELLNAGMIEEINPPKRAKFDYPKGYKYTRLVNTALKKRQADAEKALDLLHEEEKKVGVYDTTTASGLLGKTQSDGE